MGQVGRFRPIDNSRYARGQRVVVRTERGLESGEVLADASGDAGPAEGADGVGALLRRMTPQDELLAERLGRNRDAAYAACAERLAELGSSAVLLDVEHLFDCRGLYFYFLGPTDDAAEAASAELAAAYDAEARFGEFADAVEQGCGPGCGTDQAENGCGSSGGCATCAVAAACAR